MSGVRSSPPRPRPDPPGAKTPDRGRRKARGRGAAQGVVNLAALDVFLSEWREGLRSGGPGSGRYAARPQGEMDPLSCADFVVVDYTLGPWPLPPSERDARVELLRDFQSPATGLFEVDLAAARSSPGVEPGPPSPGLDVPGVEPGPLPSGAQTPAGETGPRTEDGGVTAATARPSSASGLPSSVLPGAPGFREATAYFSSALELMGARPLHALKALDETRTPSGMEALIGGLDWEDPGSVAAAGSVALTFAICADAGTEWFDRSFALLERLSDARSGLWGKSSREEPSRAVRGAFPHLLMYQRFARPLPRAAKAVAWALSARRDDGLFGEAGPGWADAAAVLALSLAFRQTGAKAKAVLSALEGVARAAREALADEGARRRVFADPHSGAGALSALALLARTHPGSVRSLRPVRFYADRHLFV